MADEKGNNFSKAGIGLATDILKSVPIDENAKNIAGQELGKTVVTLTKAINFVLLPISATVFGYDKIKDFVENRVSEKLKDIPPENILPPKGNIVGPALENLKYLDESEDDNSLKEMYANLIANSINKDKKKITHPAFTEIIKQLDSSDILVLEAMRSLGNVAFLEISKNANDGGSYLIHEYLCHDNLTSILNFDLKDLASSINNLERLKIITSGIDSYFTDEKRYAAIQECDMYQEIKNTLGKDFKESKGSIGFTVLGQRFLEACVV